MNERTLSSIQESHKRAAWLAQACGIPYREARTKQATLDTAKQRIVTDAAYGRKDLRSKELRSIVNELRNGHVAVEPTETAETPCCQSACHEGDVRASGWECAKAGLHFVELCGGFEEAYAVLSLIEASRS